MIRLQASATHASWISPHSMTTKYMMVLWLIIDPPKYIAPKRHAPSARVSHTSRLPSRPEANRRLDAKLILVEWCPSRKTLRCPAK